jgi:raffinose/stachyose/melibiose transport system permease protein
MKTLRDKKAILIFLLPALLIYTWIVFVPIIQSVYYSLIDWNGLGSKEFVGLTNYAMLIKDKVFIQALTNNLRYIAYVVSIQIVLGIVAAILLTYLKKGRGFVQTVYFIPSVVTVVAICPVVQVILLL